jgi:heavy metal translocating P-type ATPase
LTAPAASSPPAAAAETGCTLCGGPLPEPTNPFCCEGCARVSEILDAAGFKGDRRASAAYLQAARAGLVPAGSAPGTEPASPPRATSKETRTVNLCVEGLWCPSCAWLVEEVVGKSAGVHSTRVTFFADLAEVVYDPASVGEKEIARRVEALGYRVQNEGQHADRGPLLRFGAAAVLQMNVMWLSYALYAHRAGDIFDPVAGALPWILAALSAPVVFLAGAPMLRRAWYALRAGGLVMDSLIALASVAAWVYSLWATAQGRADVYFDAAAGLVTFRLLGRLLEQAAFRSAARAGAAVKRLLPRKARKLAPEGAAWVSADSLAVGDRIRVAPGERVPLDGRVVAGSGRVSTAVVDGEPRPRAVGPGSPIPGGSVCGETALDLEVTAPAASSLLARVADHVARASGRRGDTPELADALARVFIPAVLVLSGVTFVAWLSHGLGTVGAFERALTVLVVSCPCALGLAAPLSRVIAAGQLARRGVIVRGDGALDRIAAARLVAFDKTGTLTVGRPGLASLTVEGATCEAGLAAVAGLEERAGHPIAEAVRAALPPGAAIPQAADLGGEAGCGVRGTLFDAPAWVGKPEWVIAGAGEAPPPAVAEALAREQDLGRTAILASWGGGRWAALSFDDAIRAEAPGTVADLKALGLGTAVLTGDAARAAAVVSRRVGADRAVAGCVPEAKARFLEQVEAEDGRRAIFVGDGINDAPGLAASVGVAVASCTDFARETADVLLLEPGLDQISELVRSGRRMRRIIRENLAWAALYNAVLVPMAAFGRLTPVWAAAAMVTSSLLVTLNSVRLQRGASARPAAEPAVGGVTLATASQPAAR